ncbi:MAG: bifunctional glycosyltransferase family 2 protein/CDP-glycerol:glycerophosphate glycerophosphotransferase [Campylobacteraceae bacterium]|jgi:glycosyltransferase involved in cell wall biosynthesis/CDP-glycerol glycerophosphotransferase (TagB/SpsB family)|nr:bifunctional glycosyltransferase family 2 protein/CDP-glycerol:glycerophosphate glycerophosphotransferase [Campylobacteraceae bacterium]
MTKFQRKYRKFSRDPKAFFKDSIFMRKLNSIRKFLDFDFVSHIKYISLLKLWILKKPDSHLKYSVVTATYNSEKYLDDYFKSLTRQTLDFKKHIELILVDDGSTDKSAKIIKKWQKKFPKNITYIYQENQGQGAARNRGLPIIKNPWVTFIDSDDFVHFDYFYDVDKQLREHALYDVKMLSCNVISYYEARNEFKNDRPFKIFYKNEVSIVPSSDLKNFIQLAVNSAFFSADEIKRQHIFFSNSRWPSFEDGHSILRYISKVSDGYNLFCSKPKYYYRKRGDKTSSVDTSSDKKEWYIDVLKEAYLDIFELFKQKYGFVPLFVQNTILYDISWKIKYFVNDNRRAGMFSDTEGNEFLLLCDKVFLYIDIKTINSFPVELSGFWYYFKVGSIQCFKQVPVECKYAYFDKYDDRKNLIRVCFFGNEKIDLFFDGKKADIVYSKIIKREFLSRVFIYERHIWIKLNKSAQNIICKIDGRDVECDLGGKKYKSLSGIQLLSTFNHQIQARKDRYWILMDRDVEADDSAEHLYRFITKNYPKQKIYFALKKNSVDWIRLKKDDFNLIEFGSASYLSYLKGADKLISSHMDNYVIRYRKDILKGKHFVCLQHGVIKDNLSAWLNNMSIDLFITTTDKEYRSIAEDFTTYNMGTKEVVKTGLARYDTLLERAKEISTQMKILIIPTWRRYLVGGKVGTSKKELFDDFFDSKYAKAWFGLLKSKKLADLSQKYNFKIQIFPHLNMQGYFNDVQFGNHIDIILRSNIINVQDIFTESSMLITDYSSVAFNMAYLHKETIYYQFDEDEFFARHTATKGYFDYRKDGFGAVVIDEENLLKEIESLMKRGGKPAKKYLERMQETFPVRDGQNCERIYRAILALDEPLKESNK